MCHTALCIGTAVYTSRRRALVYTIDAVVGAAPSSDAVVVWYRHGDGATLTPPPAATIVGSPFFVFNNNYDRIT